MKIKLTLDGKQKNFSARQGASVRDVMREAGVNNEVVIIKLNNKITHPDARLHEGDSLEFVHVIYGG